MEMVLRASATPRPSLSSSSRPKPTTTIIPNNKPPQLLKSSSPATLSLSLFALFTPPHEAHALTLSKDQIVSSVTQMEKTFNQAQEMSSTVFETAQQVFGIVTEAVKPALPVLKQVAEQAFNAASPVLSEASKKAQDAIQSSGFDTEPVVTAAKTVVDAAQQTTKVIEDAQPIASSTVETISSADPTVIVGAGGALFLAYVLLPPILSAISFNLRGYRGDLTPAQTLDLMCTQNHIMVDIRSEKDKNNTGIPRLPTSAKSKMISVPLEDLPAKLRGLVRNSKRVEAEIAALKISYLKKLAKSSNIVILDSYSDSAKLVAKYLTSLGFKNCWIVADGFSGGKGWLQSRLGTDGYNFSFAEVLSPSRIIPGRIGTTRGTKLLSGSD
uniref:Rhodanese domain-containing protein n=1 Tax=Kalanchoe fedtschenkoi TaxID=63787 RepID=A0A7N0SVZ9_KALFE